MNYKWLSNINTKSRNNTQNLILNYPSVFDYTDINIIIKKDKMGPPNKCFFHKKLSQVNVGKLYHNVTQNSENVGLDELKGKYRSLIEIAIVIIYIMPVQVQLMNEWHRVIYVCKNCISDKLFHSSQMLKQNNYQ